MQVLTLWQGIDSSPQLDHHWGHVHAGADTVAGH